jgi:hypothetical protein
VGIALPADVFVPDGAPAQMPHWLLGPHPPPCGPDELATAHDPPECVPGLLWEWRQRGAVWQGRVSYRRPIRHVGWISHRDWVVASRLAPRVGADWIPRLYKP